MGCYPNGESSCMHPGCEDCYPGNTYWDDLKKLEAKRPEDKLRKTLAAINTLFEKIKHGDEEHQAWLKQAIEEHFRDVVE